MMKVEEEVEVEAEVAVATTRQRWENGNEERSKGLLDTFLNFIYLSFFRAADGKSPKKKHHKSDRHRTPEKSKKHKSGDRDRDRKRDRSGSSKSPHKSPKKARR